MYQYNVHDPMPSPPKVKLIAIVGRRLAVDTNGRIWEWFTGRNEVVWRYMGSSYIENVTRVSSKESRFNQWEKSLV